MRHLVEHRLFRFVLVSSFKQRIDKNLTLTIDIGGVIGISFSLRILARLGRLQGGEYFATYGSSNS